MTHTRPTKNLTLVKAVIASSVFYLGTTNVAFALINITNNTPVAVAAGVTTANGYNLDAIGATLNVASSTGNPTIIVVDTTNATGISLDNNYSNSGAGFASTVVNFAPAGTGAITVNGTIGTTNAIGTLGISGTGTAGVLFKGNIGNPAASPTGTTQNLSFTADGLATLNAAVNLTGAVSTSAPDTGTFTLSGTNKISGAVGSGSLPLKAINVNGTGVVFSDDVSAANINIATSLGTILANATTFVGDVTGSLNFTGGASTGSFVIANGSIFGSVETAKDGVNILTLLPKSFSAGLTGSLGTSDLLALDLVNIDGTNDGTNFGANSISFEGGGTTVYADTLHVTNAGSLYVTDTQTFNVNAFNIDNSHSTTALSEVAIGEFGGPVTLSVESLTLGTTVMTVGAVGATVADYGVLVLLPQATLAVNGSLDIQGGDGNGSFSQSTNYASGSVLQLLGGSKVTTTGDFTLGAGAILAANFTGADGQPSGTTGQVVAGGHADVGTIAGDTFLYVLNAPLVSDEYTLITGAAGSTLNTMTVGGGGAILGYSTVVNNTNHTLNLVVNYTPVAALANQPNTIGVAEALSVIQTTYPNIGGALGNIETALLGYEDVGSLNYGLSTIAPNVDGGAVQTSFGLPSNVYRVIGSHLSEKRLHGATVANRDATGMSAGDKEPCQAVWVKLFGEEGHQKNRDGIQGYNDTVWGLAIGSDALVRENLVLGTAFSWSNLQVRSALAGDRTRANSYQLALYGEYDFGNSPWYLDGMLSLAYNDYVTSHNIILNNFDISARGHYYGWQPGVQAEFGYDHMMNGFHVIPLISLYYTHLKLTTYTETGAGNANQLVNGEAYDMLLGGLGLQLANDYEWNNTTFEPEAHFKVFYDFINDRVQTTSQFVGAGPSFGTNGIKPAATSFDAGLSFNVYSKRSLSLGVSYDYVFADDYSENAGFVRVRYEW